MATFPLEGWGEYQSKGKRDPFVPLMTADGKRIHPPGSDEEATTGTSLLSLQGIVFDPHAESYAIINNRLVREQDDVDGVKILKIEPTTVTILADGQPQQLSIHQPTEETDTQP